jgi:rhodanese-related sulfurtransferase
MGYTDIRVLDGGLAAWKAAGLPTVSGWGMHGKEYGERIAVAEQVPQITAAELAELRRRGENVTVVDVRTDEEFLRGHVPGAYHIPGGQLVLELPALPQSPDHRLVISCAGRTRGILGAHVLRMLGLTNVTALLNGAMGWRLEGLELEMGEGQGRLRANAPVPHEVEEATQRLAREAQVRTTSVDELDAWRAAGEPHYVVDVRVPQEFRAGHVPGAVSIPTGQFALQHENFLAVGRLPVVIIADDAIRPIWAAAQCQGLGFPNTVILEGGLSAWVGRGRKLEEGTGSVETFGLEAAQRAVEGIRPAELRQLQERESNTVVLDVRSSGEFAMGHIPGTRWLTRGKLELDIERMVPSTETPLITICDTGQRSTLAAATLRSLGYTHARYLEGGLPAWSGAGLPVVDGLDGADVSREEAQSDFGSTLWTGALARTRADMEQYLSWEEALAHR